MPGADSIHLPRVKWVPWLVLCLPWPPGSFTSLLRLPVAAWVLFPPASFPDTDSSKASGSPDDHASRATVPAVEHFLLWSLLKAGVYLSSIWARATFSCVECVVLLNTPPKKRLRKWAGLPHVVGTQDVPICLLLWGDTLARSWSLDPRRTSLKRQESARFTGCRLESPLPSASLFLPLTPWTNEPHRGRRGPDLGWNPFLPSATRKFPLHWVLSLLCPNFQEPPWRWICPVPWGPHKGVESPVLRNLHLSPLPITLKIQPRGSPLLLLVLPANVWSPSRFQNTCLYGCIEY